MIYRNNGEWKLCPKKVKFKSNGKEIEEYTNKPIWYENFEKKWGGIEVLEIVDAEFTQEQIERFEKVKNMSEGHGEAVTKYIETGEFPDGYDLSELLRTGEIKTNVIPGNLIGEDIEE